MKYYAIIVAGGAGTRMNLNTPKQFLLLDKKPVLMHTILAFFSSVQNPEIIVVLNVAQHHYWKQLCITHNFTVPHQLIEGGEQRFHSVSNGLLAVKEEGIVAIHDAVRPLVSVALIDACYEQALTHGNAVAAIKPNDSIRKTIGKDSEVLDRGQILLIQTPQTFQTDQLRKAYTQRYQNSFTDDASVVEKVGFNINLIEGERSNLKITYAEDLELANFYFHKKKPQ